MSPIRRRRLLIVAALLGLVLMAAGFLFFSRGSDLKSRSTQIERGMSRAEVEGILGPPGQRVPRPGGKGTLLIWTDEVWHVAIGFDTSDRAEILTHAPANDWVLEISSRLRALFQ